MTLVSLFGAQAIVTVVWLERRHSKTVMLAGTNPGLVFFVLLMAIFLVLYLFGHRQMLKRKRYRFSGRDDMTPDTFYSTFYADSGLSRDDVVWVLTHVGGLLEIPASKLRPQDRFDTELAPARGWEYDDGLGILERELLGMMRKAGLKPDISKISTLDDCIRTFAAFSKGDARRAGSTLGGTGGVNS